MTHNRLISLPALAGAGAAGPGGSSAPLRDKDIPPMPQKGKIFNSRKMNMISSRNERVWQIITPSSLGVANKLRLSVIDWKRSAKMGRAGKERHARPIFAVLNPSPEMPFLGVAKHTGG
jgi:hypothetical protein